jgi:hypothetical protein
MRLFASRTIGVPEVMLARFPSNATRRDASALAFVSLRTTRLLLR